jgi:hypothetical protein
MSLALLREMFAELVVAKDAAKIPVQEPARDD